MLDTDTGYRIGVSYKNASGFGASLNVLYQCSSLFGIESGFRYVQKNYGYRHKAYKDTSHDYTDSEDVKNHFLEFQSDSGNL